MLRLLVFNLVFQTGTFVGFGFVVFLVQLGRSRFGEADTNDQVELDGSDLDFVDDTVGMDDTIAEEQVVNPFEMGVSGSVARQQGALVEANSGPVERWHFLTELRFATEVFLVAFLPTVILRIVMVLILNDATSHPFLEMLSDGANWDIMLLIVLMAVIVAPLAEELEYRVVVLGGLEQMGFRTGGWVIASVLFSLAHGFPDCIALLPLSFLLGYTYLQRRSYRTVAMVHFLFNGFNMMIALLALQ